MSLMTGVMAPTGGHVVKENSFIIDDPRDLSVFTYTSDAKGVGEQFQLISLMFFARFDKKLHVTCVYRMDGRMKFARREGSLKQIQQLAGDSMKIDEGLIKFKLSPRAHQNFLVWADGLLEQGHFS